MKALILLSHGSRREESNREMMLLAQEMAGMEDNKFTQIQCAFQQFAEPTFAEVVEGLTGQGIQKITVFPLFLSAGSHVQEDVPEMIQAAKQRFPQLQMTVTPHLGGTADFAAFLLNSVR